MPDHFVDLPTNWPEVLESQDRDRAAARDAVERMLHRYSGAIQRYIAVFFRDPNNANDVFQKFAIKFAEGAFHNVSPEKGSFRDYIKVVLRNLIRSHQAEMSRLMQPLPAELQDRHEVDPVTAMCEIERSIWQNEIMSRAWKSLEAHDRERPGKLPLSQLMQFLMKQPQMSHASVAQHFSEQLGQPVSAEMITSLRHDGRSIFRKALYREVADTLAYPRVENVEQEMIDLGMHKWVATTIRSVYARRARR